MSAQRLRYGDILYLTYVDLGNQEAFASFPSELDHGTHKLVLNAMEVLVNTYEQGGEELIEVIEMENSVLHCFYDPENKHAVVLIVLGHSYPDKMAKQLLEELGNKINNINRMHNPKHSSNYDYQLALEPFMRQMVLKYAAYSNSGMVDMVRVKLDGAKEHIREGIDQIMVNVANVELLDTTSRKMHFKANELSNISTELASCMPRRKICAIVVGSLVTVAITIYIVLPCTVGIEHYTFG